MHTHSKNNGTGFFPRDESMNISCGTDTFIISTVITVLWSICNKARKGASAPCGAPWAQLGLCKTNQEFGAPESGSVPAPRPPCSPSALTSRLLAGPVLVVHGCADPCQSWPAGPCYTHSGPQQLHPCPSLLQASAFSPGTAGMALEK